MSEQSGLFPTARSWRDIPQEVTSRAMSKTGRRRYAIGVGKLVTGILFAGLATWGTVALINAIEYHPSEIARADDVGPVRATPEFQTDGVLTPAWAVKQLALPNNATLMELDLRQLQSRLLESGQVRVAMLEKKFPDTLVVRLNERTPVARVMVRDGSGAPRMYFVARDGFVFQGFGYDARFCDGLPWLDGVKLSRTSGRFDPIAGMDVVSDLITKARYESEHLYSLFRVISLAHFASDGFIEVRSPVCESVVFTTHEDFFRQLAYFDYICDTMKPTADKPLSQIDLSLGHDVPVAFKDPVNAAATTNDDHRRTAPISFQFLQRNSTQREL